MLTALLAHPDFARPVLHSLLQSGAEVFQYQEDGEKLLDWMGRMKPDLILSAFYPKEIDRHVCRLAKFTVNLHPSLLPRYQGPSPTNWALIEDEKETGVTAHFPGKPFESGPILLQRKISIAEDWTDGELRSKLADLMGEMTKDILKLLAGPDPLASARKQEPKEVTTFPPLTHRDAHIRFDQGSRRVLKRFLGVTPFPGATTDINGKTMEIISLSVEGDETYNAEPGSVLKTDHKTKTLWIKTIDRTVRLKVKDLPEEKWTGQMAGGSSPFSVKAQPREVQYDKNRPAEEELDRYLEFPDMVVVAVAYPCNAFCPNCPYTDGNSDIRLKYADANFIPVDLFKKIARECGEARSIIRITGGGEPMLHPDGMTGLIEYAIKEGARVYLNTNGSRISKSEADRLLACGTDNIEISVDAADPETYAIVRKGLDWKNLLATVAYLIQKRNQTKSPTTLEVSIINQTIVSGKIGEIEKFWYKMGVDNVIVRKFLTWGASTSLDPHVSPDPMAYLDRDEGVPCPYPFHRLNIDTRGKIEVCGFDISGRTNFGNVGNQTIREIWKGPMFHWWREKHRTGKGGDIPLCAECPDWKYRSWTHNYRKALKKAALHREEAISGTGLGSPESFPSSANTLS